MPTGKSPKFTVPAFDKEAFDKLSKEDKESFVKANPAMAKSFGFKTKEEQTVPKVKYDEDIEALKEKIRDLNKKLEEQKKQKTEFREQRDEFSRRFDKKREELAEVEDNMDRLRKELGRANEEIAELKKKPKAVPVKDERETTELKKMLRAADRDRESLVSQLQDSRLELETARTELEEIETENSSLKAEISAMKSSIQDSDDSVTAGMQSVGKIRMCSPTSLESELFTLRRYSVRIAKDMSYVKFRPDAEGQVFCEDGTMEIPALPEYIQYSEGLEFDALSDGETMVVRLGS